MRLALVALLSLLPFSALAYAPREEIIPLGTDLRASAGSTLDRSAAPRAELVGQVRLGNRAHRVGLRSAICARRGERVEALRLRVLGNAALLAELSFDQADGSPRGVKLRRQFQPNSETGWIFLPPQSCLKHVTLVGQNAHLSPNSAVVQVFALVGEARQPPKEARPKRTAPARLRLSQAH